jgi:hypothetical protein
VHHRAPAFDKDEAMERAPARSLAVGKWFGIAALIAAIVAIFVPISGIMISVLAVILAIVAALCGEYGYAAGTSAVVGINSFLLSPIIWMMVMWPGQLVIAFYVLCMVGAPLAAIAFHARFLDR